MKQPRVYDKWYWFGVLPTLVIVSTAIVIFAQVQMAKEAAAMTPDQARVVELTEALDTLMDAGEYIRDADNIPDCCDEDSWDAFRDALDHAAWVKAGEGND